MAKVWMRGMNGPAMDQFMTDLRSGEFTQFRGHLYGTDPRYGVGMCCLGVATERFHTQSGLTKDIDAQSGLVAYSWGARITLDNETVPYRTTALMPLPVAQYLGIPKAFLDKMGEDVSILLVAHEDEAEFDRRFSEKLGFKVIGATTLNDSYKRSFSEIADRFEETFKVEED